MRLRQSDVREQKATAEAARAVYGVIVEDGPPAQLFGSPQKERTRAFLEQVL